MPTTRLPPPPPPMTMLTCCVNTALHVSCAGGIRLSSTVLLLVHVLHVVVEEVVRHARDSHTCQHSDFPKREGVIITVMWHFFHIQPTAGRQNASAGGFAPGPPS